MLLRSTLAAAMMSRTMYDNTSRQRPELVQTPDSTAVQTTIPIAEAAARLGISADAVRKRIQRGKLTGHKTDSGWTVNWIEPDTSPETVQTLVRDQSALVDSLQSQIDYLREQVSAEREARIEAERRHAAEIERRDVLLREALERIPQMPLGLPAGDVHEHPPQDVNPGPLRGDAGETIDTPLQSDQDAQGPAWRRWWRRVTGGG